MANKWTPEEDNKIISLREQGLTAKEITTHIPGRTYSSVRSRIQAICSDNKNRSWSKEDKEKFQELKEQGYTNAYIAKVLGRTVSAVSTYASRYWHGKMD